LRNHRDVLNSFLICLLDIIGVFVDLENGQLIYWKNGVKGFTISNIPKVT